MGKQLQAINQYHEIKKASQNQLNWLNKVCLLRCSTLGLIKQLTSENLTDTPMALGGHALLNDGCRSVVGHCFPESNMGKWIGPGWGGWR